MNEIIGKVKNAGKGIVKFFKKIKSMIQFFMTQVRNDRGFDNIGLNCSYNCSNNDENNRKFSCKMV